MDLHNEGIATWLENILTYPAGTTDAAIRELYLGMDLHKLANFDSDQDAQGVPLGLTHITSNYDSIISMGSYSTHGITLQCQKQVDLSAYPGLDLTTAQLYIAPPNGNGGTFTTDYPHNVNGANQANEWYRWSVTMLLGSANKGKYIKSMGETWVNFPLQLFNFSDGTTVDVNLVKDTTSWSIVKPDQSIQYGQKALTNLTTLPMSTYDSNSVAQVAALSATPGLLRRPILQYYYIWMPHTL